MLRRPLRVGDHTLVDSTTMWVGPDQIGPPVSLLVFDKETPTYRIKNCIIFPEDYSYFPVGLHAVGVLYQYTTRLAGTFRGGPPDIVLGEPLPFVPTPGGVSLWDHLEES